MEENYIRIKTRRKVDHLTWHCSGGVEWFSFPILDQFDFVVNGFSTRVGGVSEGDVGSLNLSVAREMAMHMEVPEDESRRKVRENHRRLAEAVGYTTDALVFSNQTHTDNIRILQDVCGQRSLPEGARRGICFIMEEKADLCKVRTMERMIPLK